MPTAYGGQGRSFLDAVLVIEEMAKSCTVTARIVVETNMGAISTVMHYGTEEQRRLAAELVLGTPYLSGMMYQPVFGSGRAIPIDPMNHRAPVTGIPLWLKATGCSRSQPTQVRSAAIDFAYGADRIPCGCLRMSFSTTSRRTDRTASAGSDSGR